MRFRLRALFRLTAAVAVAATCLSFWLRSIDGISGNLLAVIFSGDTEWAAGYTDEGFRAALVGMTREEVYALLGSPLYTWDNYRGAEVVEWWTRSPADANFRQRALVFHGDKVVEKVSEYWLD